MARGFATLQPQGDAEHQQTREERRWFERDKTIMEGNNREHPALQQAARTPKVANEQRQANANDRWKGSSKAQAKA